ncbi:hypothetical protein HK405_008640 [Cladochytrium tenue]|nr:hypothetical protein HK405_008640 [Cladochytrium tenue]
MNGTTSNTRREWTVSNPTTANWDSLILTTGVQPYDQTELKPGHAILRHLCAIVCFTDVHITEGVYFRTYPTPYTPGYSFVAEVEAVAPLESGVYPDGCREFKKGDIVAAMVSIGGWRTHSVHDLTDPKKNLVLIEHPIKGLPGRAKDDVINSQYPGKALDLAQLTAVILNITTAYQMIHRSGVQITDGDSVLVHSAAGGVGSGLCELLRAERPDVKVLGTCSSSKAEFVRSLGCEPIDYKNNDFVEAVHVMTSGQGVKAAFDAVGGSNYARSYDSLAADGKLVLYGSTGAAFGENLKSVLGVMSKNALFWRKKSTTFYGAAVEREKKPTQFLEDMQRVFQLLSEGKINPHIDKRFALEDVKDALAFVKSGSSKGNVVVEF